MINYVGKNVRVIMRSTIITLLIVVYVNLSIKFHLDAFVEIYIIASATSVSQKIQYCEQLLL